TSAHVWGGTVKMSGERVKIAHVNKKGNRWLQAQHNGQPMQLSGYKDENVAEAWLVELITKYVSGEVDKLEMEELKREWLEGGNRVCKRPAAKKPASAGKTPAAADGEDGEAAEGAA
ncbi:unnamed protein product, partial [Prorocentrum cordatum]